MKRIIVLIGVLLLLSACEGVTAFDTVEQLSTGNTAALAAAEAESDVDDEAACTGQTTHPQGEILAEAYGVDYDEIMGYFCAGYGFGVIDQIYALAQNTDMTVEEIFEMLEAGEVTLDDLLGDDEDEADDPEDPEDDDEQDEDEQDDGDETEGDDEDEATNQGAYCTGEQEAHPVGTSLAESYEVDYDTIMATFCEGVGFGVINQVYAMAEAEDSPYSAEEMLALLEEGEMSLGQLKQELGFAGPPDGVPGGPPEGVPGNGKGNNGNGKGNGKGKGGP